MESTIRERLNKLRQEKEYGYKNEITYNKINLDTQYIIDLEKKYIDNSEFGKKVREYLIFLKNNGK